MGNCMPTHKVVPVDIIIKQPSPKAKGLSPKALPDRYTNNAYISSPELSARLQLDFSPKAADILTRLSSTSLSNTLSCISPPSSPFSSVYSQPRTPVTSREFVIVSLPRWHSVLSYRTDSSAEGDFRSPRACIIGPGEARASEYKPWSPHNQSPK